MRVMINTGMDRGSFPAAKVYFFKAAKLFSQHFYIKTSAVLIMKSKKILNISSFSHIYIIFYMINWFQVFKFNITRLVGWLVGVLWHIVVCIKPNPAYMTAKRCESKSNVRLYRFQSQLEASYVSILTEEFWYNETVCRWMTIYTLSWLPLA